MVFLPIVDRELRVLSRRPSLPRSRVAATAIGILAGCIVFFSNIQVPQTELGRELFFTFAALLSLYCLLAGMSLTRDCMSSEKREGTIGLLFLTNLRGYDVVLGKLAASALGSLYQIVAVFPLLAVPFVLGGVDFGMFSRLLVALCGLMGFSVLAGILGSTLCVQERHSAAVASLIVVGVNLFPLIIGMLLAWNRNGPIDDIWFEVCPWHAAYTAVVAAPMVKGIGTSLLWGLQMPAGFLFSMGLLIFYGLVCLVAACLIAPRAWQERQRSQRKGRVLQSIDRLAGSPTENLRWRRLCLDRNPIAWLAMRRPRGNISLWGFFAFIGAAWVAGYWRFGKSDWLEVPVCIAFGLVAQSAVKVLVSNQAAYRIVEDRRLGGMELILCTPLTVREILSGYWRALRNYFAGPLLCLMIVEALLYWLARVEGGREWETLFWVNAVVVGFDLWAMAWIAMRAALRSNSGARAAAQAKLIVMVLPWVILVLVGVTTDLLGYYNFNSIYVWGGISVVVDLAFGGWAMSLVNRHFRDMATQNAASDARRGFWRMLRGLLPAWRRGGRRVA